MAQAGKNGNRNGEAKPVAATPPEQRTQEQKVSYGQET
jgi:hypothetical protein